MIKQEIAFFVIQEENKLHPNKIPLCKKSILYNMQFTQK